MLFCPGRSNIASLTTQQVVFFWNITAYDFHMDENQNPTPTPVPEEDKEGETPTVPAPTEEAN